MDARKKLLYISIFLIALLVLLVVLFGNSKLAESPNLETTNDVEQVEQTATASPAEQVRDELRIFTAQEFKTAYDSLSLPNIIPIIEPPKITGNAKADAQIQKQAEERGYQLRQVVSGLLDTVEGQPTQQLLIASWNDLQQSALEEGVALGFVSAYRSVENQRDLFLQGLTAAGAAVDGIASGSQVELVDRVLRITAPPGYSRHHSGYTIDVEDPGFAIFADSDAYAWISANNFEKAKIHGFIPSYPNGLTKQGPNPEPWEFVWVGPTVTYQ